MSETRALSSRRLFVFSFLAGLGLLAASALSAWSGPTQSPPAGNVPAPVNVGTADQVKNAGLALNSLLVSGNAAVYKPSTVVRLGVNTSNPLVALDVAGSVKLGNGGELCQTVSAGVLRWNAANKSVDYCDGTAWKSLSAVAPPVEPSPPQTFTYATPGSHTWTKPSGNFSTVTMECWGGGGAGGTMDEYYSSDGGGGGAYSSYTTTYVAAPASATVTVGRGGIPCASGGGPGVGVVKSSCVVANADGVASSIGSLVIAEGGKQGGLNGGAGGTGSVRVAEQGGRGGYSYGDGSSPTSGQSRSCAGAGGGASIGSWSAIPVAPGASGCGGNGGSMGAAGAQPGGGGGGASISNIYYYAVVGSMGAGGAGKCVIQVH